MAIAELGIRRLFEGIGQRQREKCVHNLQSGESVSADVQCPDVQAWCAVYPPARAELQRARAHGTLHQLWAGYTYGAAKAAWMHSHGPTYVFRIYDMGYQRVLELKGIAIRVSYGDGRVAVPILSGVPAATPAEYVHAVEMFRERVKKADGGGVPVLTCMKDGRILEALSPAVFDSAGLLPGAIEANIIGALSYEPKAEH